MSRSPLVLWVTPLLFSALAMAQPRFTAGVHEDPRLGYKIKVPEKWTMVPVDIDEKWIVAKYLCNREYAGKVSYMAWTPQMRIVHFSPEKAKVTEKTETRGDTTYMSKQAAFRNYKDWFKEIIKSTNLGHYIESETTDTLGDVPVTRFEIMTTSSNEKALKFVCWVYERKSDGSTFAVEFSQINDYYKNLADDFERSFKSFRFTDVEAGNGAAAADSELENPMWTRDREKWRELPKQERWKIRPAMEIKRRERVLADVPQGWFVQESKSKRFTAISHTDKKHTTLVLDTAEAVWNWVDKRFNSLSDEYVMAGVIRICEDWNEANTYGAKSAALDS